MQATIRFPDGTRTLATVAEPPRLTQRMPVDLVDQFGLRPMTVVLNLTPADHLSENQKVRSEEHTSELQSRLHLVCRLLLEKKKQMLNRTETHATDIHPAHTRSCFHS